MIKLSLKYVSDFLGQSSIKTTQRNIEGRSINISVRTIKNLKD